MLAKVAVTSSRDGGHRLRTLVSETQRFSILVPIEGFIRAGATPQTSHSRKMSDVGSGSMLSDNWTYGRFVNSNRTRCL